MAHMIACSSMFVEGYDFSGLPEVTVPLTFEQERKIFKQVHHQYDFGFTGLGYDRRIALLRPTGLELHPESEMNPEVPKVEKDRRLYYTDETPEQSRLVFDTRKNGKGHALARTAKASLFTGFIEEGKPYSFRNNVTLSFGKTRLDWATVTLTEINPGRFLLVLTGEMLNTEMTLRPHDGDRLTLSKNEWGKEPIRCEGIRAELTFKDRKDTEFQCRSLDESGNRKQEIIVKTSTNGGSDEMNFTIDTKPEYRTVWYEIQRKVKP